MNDSTAIGAPSANLSSPLYLLYSAVTEADLHENLGRAEYSYFFVREIFRRALEKHAQVILISDPAQEVDRIFEECERKGQECIFLSFAPPHRTFVDLRSPTIPVFAWEFDTIPDEVWDDEPRNDWRWVLAGTGCAITHSEYSANATRSAMGADFPVASIPAPLWDSAREACSRVERAPQGETELIIDGSLFDSRAAPTGHAAPTGQTTPPPTHPARKGLMRRLRLSVSLLALWYREVIADLLPITLRKRLSQFARTIHGRLTALRSRRRPRSSPPGEPPPRRVPVRIAAGEIVYTSVFNPHDGRKNWHDMLTAFCSALGSIEDATLVLKFVHHDSSSTLAEARTMVPKLPPHRCRLIIVAGFLDDASYRALIARSAFVVNSSLSEGQCLPLMEFMSCGKPAVAPRNTAMEEYVDEEVAFVVNSSPEPCCWPHDSRNVFRAHRYRIDWHSLNAAFRDSYRVIKHDPARYAQMCARAVLRLQDHCSEDVALSRLRQFLHDRKRPVQIGQPGADRPGRTLTHG